MKNRVTELLQAGKISVDAQLRFGSPATAELFGLAGFDWLVIDTEHAPQPPFYPNWVTQNAKLGTRGS